ncbi:MAG: response regulator, partial [Bacteroidota bacterium]|nr:response regulator [Bacteroidota bacterium]
KYTSEGKISIYAKTIANEAGWTEIEFSVKDSGKGISEERIGTIWERFVRSDKASHIQQDITELGLTVVKHLIELQGGKIDVKSKENEGSVFTFSLRFKTEVSPDQEIYPADELLTPAELSHLRVLLVEDNPVNRLLVQKVLQNYGIKLQMAENGQEALEKLVDEEFDVILMDIQMPLMDGYEATRLIRKHFIPPKRDVPIIAITAHALSDEIEQCLRSGMNDYITKPFLAEELLQKISHAASSLENDLFIPGRQAQKADERKNKPAKPKHSVQNANNKATSASRGDTYLDLTYLNRIANGNRQYVEEMMSICQEQIPEFMLDIDKAMANSDWELLSRTVHKLKSSVAIVGAEKVKTVAISVEEKIKGDPKIGELKPIVESLRQLIYTLQSEIQLELREKNVA